MSRCKVTSQEGCGFTRSRKIFQRHVAKGEMAANPYLRPVRISAWALGAGQPQRDLLVPRQHRMLVQSPIARRMFDDAEVLVAAVQLTALPGIYVDQDASAVAYVHLLFDQHQVILAEGAPTRSLYPGAEAMKALPADALRELKLLFPALVDPAAAFPNARRIPTGARWRKLNARHAKNTKPLIVTAD